MTKRKRGGRIRLLIKQASLNPIPRCSKLCLVFLRARRTASFSFPKRGGEEFSRSIMKSSRQRKNPFSIISVPPFQSFCPIFSIFLSPTLFLFLFLFLFLSLSLLSMSLTLPIVRHASLEPWVNYLRVRHKSISVSLVCNTDTRMHTHGPIDAIENEIVC